VTGDLLSWHLDVIFTETPEGWVLTDMSVEPVAGPGVFDAISTLFRILAERGEPLRGGYFNPTEPPITKEQ